MVEGVSDAYLSGLSESDADRLSAANAPGLSALTKHLASGQAVAFLGAGASAPLYPLWIPLVEELIDAAVRQQLPTDAANTCRAISSSQPDSVVELLRRKMGVPRFREALRETFRVRRDLNSGRTWTPTHELVCRCAFRGIVTTNYDPGIVDARMRVRPRAVSTSFTSWTDEWGLDSWATGDVFGVDELPVLYAHGHHGRTDELVLATTEYRRAYRGKLPEVLRSLMQTRHVVWIGFSMADARIAAILREVEDHAGTTLDPGAPPRHIAVMSWRPGGNASDAAQDPSTMRHLAEISYGTDLVLYPEFDGDHSALYRLLEDLTSKQFPPLALGPEPARISPRTAAEFGGQNPEVETGASNDPHATLGPQSDDEKDRRLPSVGSLVGLRPTNEFIGRVEELRNLDRWAADPQVRLIGVTAWGGAGKTTLISEWIRRGYHRYRSGSRAVFTWDFNADPSVESWLAALLDWGVPRGPSQLKGGARLETPPRAASAVLNLLASQPIVLVLDGLEGAQDSPSGHDFGRFLDGVLREILTGACRLDGPGLVVLTSRFPFADLEGFDGSSARILELPPLTPAEGSSVIQALGGGWPGEAETRRLAEDVDGHALAVTVLGGLLADNRRFTDIDALRDGIVGVSQRDARVARVLRFYAERLAEGDRLILAVASLFSRPVRADDVLLVARSSGFRNRFAQLTADAVLTAAQTRLSGLMTRYPDGSLAVHPIVREEFRKEALIAAAAAARVIVRSVPSEIESVDDGRRVAEAIELLLDAGEYRAADRMFGARTRQGRLWLALPAVQQGRRAATAFVSNSKRVAQCRFFLSRRQTGFYLSTAGVLAAYSGDLVKAIDYLGSAVEHEREFGDPHNLSIVLQSRAECLAVAGRLGEAEEAAREALTMNELVRDFSTALVSHGYLAWILDLRGDVVSAEEHFHEADRIALGATRNKGHVHGLCGVQWSSLLSRTGRSNAARRLALANLRVSSRTGARDLASRCEVQLAILSLTRGGSSARFRAESAVAVFRSGEWLTELAEALPVLAVACLTSGDHRSAMQAATEAVDLSGPRGFIVSHASALAARARVLAESAGRTNLDRSLSLRRSRDDANAALRLALRHDLPWQELSATEAHAHLDEQLGADDGWRERAAALRSRLTPSGLIQDPLVELERTSVRPKAARRTPSAE